MKTITRMVMALVATGTMALFATTASAVEPRLNATPNTSAAVTGKSFAPGQLLAQKAPSAKKIVVAGRRGRRGRAIGLGILAGVGTAILLSKSARAHRRNHHYYEGNYRHRSRHHNRCAKWEYKCHEYGHRRACRKFYNRCGY